MPLTKDFKILRKAVEKQYAGKPVPLKYQKRFGKIYSKKEAATIAYPIAKTRGIKIELGNPVKKEREIFCGKYLEFGNDIELGKGLDLGK
ncbi:MAG: hypothetical protein PHD04_05265 [Candidatus Pacebacteria bacterium]|nr:hypothetical protein [Candidatus Paceibacterota bacterium]